MKLLLAGILWSAIASGRAVQNAYELCQGMPDADDSQRCLVIVRAATRIYPQAVLDMCKKLNTDSYCNRVLQATRDRVFPQGAAEVCLPHAQDSKIQILLRCLETAGTISPKMRRENSELFEVRAFYWETFEKAVNAAESHASKRCKGWFGYAPNDAHWKRNACWETTHEYVDTDYALETRPAMWKGKPYDAFTIVPYRVVRSYSRYHCRSDFYCYRDEKDYSEVQGN